MQKPRKTQALGNGQRTEYAPVPVIVPSAEVVRRLLLDVAKNHLKLLLFVIFKVWLAMHEEEAYRSLEDPWSFIRGGTFRLPLWNGQVRCIRILPAA